MKIVDRTTFLAMPAGTVFQKFAPQHFGGLAVKGDTWSADFLVDDLGSPWPADCDSDHALSARIRAMEEEGISSGPLDFHCTGRDGHYNQEQLFAVYEEADVRGLIARLEETLA